MKPIEELPNNGVPVLLMRRTRNDTVKVFIGYRDAFGAIQKWYAVLPPTHFGPVPPFPKRSSVR